MKTQIRFLYFYLISFILLSSSCGIISKTRYGNGFKLNIGENWGKADGEPVGKKPSNKHSQLTPIQGKENLSLISENQNQANEVQISQSELEKMVQAKPVLESYQNQTVNLENPKNLAQRPPTAQEVGRPMERNAKWSGILFYGSLILYYLLAILGESVLLSVFASFISIAWIVAFILAIVALGNIRRSGYTYRGRGLAISVIVLWSLVLISALFFWFFLFLIFL